MVVDVQATFLGNASKSDLIKEIGKLCLRQDPNLPKRLSKEEKTQALQRPDFIKLRKAKSLLEQEIKEGSRARDDVQYKQVKNQLRALQQRIERETFIQILCDFHSTADLDCMVAQLNGDLPASTLPAPVKHVLEERNLLANSLFQPATESSFADMVETMARLSMRYESRNHRKYDTPSPDPQAILRNVNKPVSTADVSMSLDTARPIPEVKVANRLQKRVQSKRPAEPSKPMGVGRPATPLICLFCWGIPKRGRTQNFASSGNLRRHYRQIHFQYQVGPFVCPVPSCIKIIHDSTHFANHATTAHRSNLGVRASILKSRKHTPNPGHLPSFIL